MKKLYRQKWIIRTIFEKNGKPETITDRSSGYSDIRYGDVPGESVKEIDEWNALFDYFGYEKDFFGYKSRKGLWFNFNYSDEYGWQRTMKIYKDKFAHLLEWNEVKIIDPSSVSMRKLFDELPSDQFVKYMMDSGFGIESIRLFQSIK